MIRSTSTPTMAMTERPPTRHGRAAREKAIRENWSIESEKQLALERYEAQEDTSRDDVLDENGNLVVVRSGRAPLAFGLVDDSDEPRELDRRRKARERGGEPELPKGLPWWESEDRQRRKLLSSPELLRGLLEADLEAKGATLHDALATMKRGRIPHEQRELHDLLARRVARMHRCGAPLTKLAQAIGKDRRSVEQLVAQGQAPCRRHDVFRKDCPACLGI
jgi:hypothetical protein